MQRRSFCCAELFFINVTNKVNAAISDKKLLHRVINYMLPVSGLFSCRSKSGSRNRKLRRHVRSVERCCLRAG